MSISRIIIIAVIKGLEAINKGDKKECSMDERCSDQSVPSDVVYGEEKIKI